MPVYRTTPEMARLSQRRGYRTIRPEPGTQGDGFSLLPQGPTPENLMGQEAAERTLQFLSTPTPFGD